ncbi:hypothetical protein Bsp3421_004412 [Burkholderia sp. FERM BP-3421]|uniref:hypothetical protein n=1 Tax=Burkholderia sp. FERM BP-3421 TaxID=1494466 RepID=UPI0023606EE4|nr:hypothetical protein [Burkholderia sp. FERM BP-3421]WDD94296.1 hypothetical protein Bsp3421_004412 [Burkholderia sp. FERM BP-3421]
MAYRAPGEGFGMSELRVDAFRDLHWRSPWNDEIWPDYAAPIVRAAGDDADAVIANFGMMPKVQPAESGS